MAEIDGAEVPASTDGRWLYYSSMAPGNSDDGRYLCFQSDETGRWDIHVMEIETGR